MNERRLIFQEAPGMDLYDSEEIQTAPGEHEPLDCARMTFGAGLAQVWRRVGLLFPTAKQVFSTSGEYAPNKSNSSLTIREN